MRQPVRRAGGGGRAKPGGRLAAADWPLFHSGLSEDWRGLGADGGATGGDCGGVDADHRGVGDERSGPGEADCVVGGYGMGLPVAAMRLGQAGRSGRDDGQAA